MASIRDLLSPVNDRDSNEPEENERHGAAKIDDVPETTHFIVEFILDIICPYSYIGLKNLNAAIADYKTSHPEATFEVVCSPFLLDPLAARSAYDKQIYLNLTKHTPSYFADLGSPLGITFSWAGRTGSTRDAHKLLRFALEASPTTARSTAFASAPPPPPPASPPSPGRGPAQQLRLLEALFAAHHTSDEDISSPSALARAARAATGLPAAAVDSVLRDPQWDRALDALLAHVAAPRRGLRVRAVPTFIVNDRYVVGGSQSPGFLVEEFERMRLGRAGREGGGTVLAAGGCGEIFGARGLLA
ncbi:thioredoxin-like protein [Jackrogersella minutella]|nr:thioredoxin-like protein [Jackrogersella minutella]